MSEQQRAAAIAGVAVVGMLLVGLLWLRPAARWYSCQGGDGLTALVRGATMGAPSDLECLAVALEDDAPPPDEPVTTDGPLVVEPVTTATTESPAVVAERERVEAERQQAEAERQARIDACFAASDAEWAAWDEAYVAWLDATAGQGDYDAWLADHPEPITPDCYEP